MDHSSPQRKSKGPAEFLERISKKNPERDGQASELKAPPSRTKVFISQSALIANFRALSALAPKVSLIPMIKANAYGHGMVWAAQTLKQESNIYAFGVATIQEAIELREGLGTKSRHLPILCFSGATPWTDEMGSLCEAYNITPVIVSDDDWISFKRGSWQQKIPYELKFNTGMNRLGISMQKVGELVSHLSKFEPEHKPQGILTHLATAENPDDQLCIRQLEAFNELKRAFSGVCPAAHFHFANSAALWNAKSNGLERISDVARVGISLYGALPWEGAPARGIEPVMSMVSSVIAIRTLRAGESIGYGASFRIPKGDPLKVAIVGAGYADGIHRVASNRGSVMVGKGSMMVKARILGRVSMDLTAIEAGPQTRVGDEVEFFGVHAPIWNLAKAAETIPYEILTSVGTRVQRIYGS